MSFFDTPEDEQRYERRPPRPKFLFSEETPKQTPSVADDLIASQARRIKELESENASLRKELKECNAFFRAICLPLANTIFLAVGWKIQKERKAMKSR